MTRITTNSNPVTKPSPKPSQNLKLLYSYNGTIMPRHTDGKLRYIGGHTRVLSVPRSVTFSELSVKFFEACGFSVKLKCKLPTEDLDVLVTVECDEDLKAVVAEYELGPKAVSRDRISLSSSAAIIPQFSSKFLIPAKTKGSDANGKSSSSSHGDVLGLGGYALDDDEDKEVQNLYISSCASSRPIDLDDANGKSSSSSPRDILGLGCY
ncbi:Phox/Bem1p [Artemisia annua]|uniref:Phox/Bem1p n=1 Tax=Artemisia annua TaxID=35608 RepID=A0A2U1PU13_ARTAN|nr:Phox/Bem1p [Artemisia annua]